MSPYQQQHDPRYFSHHPQFPEPQKSSSWFGWLLMVIAALIGGFFMGQTVKIEEKSPITPPEPLVKDTQEPTNDKDTFAVVVEEPKVVPKPTKTAIQTKFIDLDDEIIARFTADFENIGQADKMFTKREFKENPELITRYPELAKLLGFYIEDENDTNQPL